MATPQRPTKEQANENRRKQQVLKQAGYNIKTDGSWGPWLEQQYRKVTAKKAPKTNQANVGVMALPAAAALLEGTGSLSLPAISAPSLAAALPVALVAGPIAAEVYNQRRGIYPRTELTPEQQQSTVYSPDATRVNRPIVISRTITQTQSRPIGEMYINPSLARSKAISMAATSDSIQTTPRDSISPKTNNWSENNWPETKRNKVQQVLDKFKKKKNTSEQPKKPLLKKVGPIAKGFIGFNALDAGRVTVQNNLNPTGDAQMFIPWLVDKVSYGLMSPEQRALKDINSVIDKISTQRNIENAIAKRDSLLKGYIENKQTTPQTTNYVDSLTNAALQADQSLLDSLDNVYRNR